MYYLRFKASWLQRVIFREFLLPPKCCQLTYIVYSTPAEAFINYKKVKNYYKAVTFLIIRYHSSFSESSSIILRSSLQIKQRFAKNVLKIEVVLYKITINVFCITPLFIFILTFYIFIYIFLF